MSKHYGCVALCDPQRYKQKEQGYTGDNITIQNRNAVHKSDRFAWTGFQIEYTDSSDAS